MNEWSLCFIALIEEVQGMCDVVNVEVEENGADGAALWYPSIKV